MRVRGATVVRFEYELRVDGGTVDGTHEGEPVAVLWGHARELPAGLEWSLGGRAQGPFGVSVPSERAHGPHEPEKIYQASRRDFPPGVTVEVGEELYVEDESGAPVGARIVAVDGHQVTVDANPRLAGKTLVYSGVIHSIREATPGEIRHGHAHGEGRVDH